MTPMELETQEIGVRLARSTVLIFGLGMGWSAAVSALRDAVETVIVVEPGDRRAGLPDARGMNFSAETPSRRSE